MPLYPQPLLPVRAPATNGDKERFNPIGLIKKKKAFILLDLQKKESFHPTGRLGFKWRWYW
jgi:hypothetical protein